MVWLATQAASASDSIAYRARPYVCGAIGPWDPAVMQRLRRGSPTGLREIHRSSRAVLLASRAPGRWKTAGGQGFFADDIKVTNGATTVFADGAEAGLNGWTAVGFTAVGSTLTTAYDNFYIASNRQYVSYDSYVRCEAM